MNSYQRVRYFWVIVLRIERKPLFKSYSDIFVQTNVDDGQSSGEKNVVQSNFYIKIVICRKKWTT